MILKKIKILTYLMSLISVTSALANPNFEASEHVAIGNNIILSLPSDNVGGKNYPLHFPNGLNMTYGDLVAMGDFYQIVGENISQPYTEEARKIRFLAAFNSLANNPKTVDEALKILTVIRDEEKAVQDGILRGEQPDEIYRHIDMENNRRWNCITGGGCDAVAWWATPGRYLLLATQDIDHFGDNAWKVYSVGHQVAIEHAIMAHQTQDVRQLEIAYAMDAFASHYLSDRFATGHMRTPRVELPAMVTPSVVGAALASYMHREDNKYGLHVHNIRGDKWMAYGDGFYFNPKSLHHKEMLEKAMQTSVDEIYAAYQFGYAPVNGVNQLIPIHDEMNGIQKVDVAALFYWDVSTQQLLRRLDVTKPYLGQWTVDWWGWSTLLLLSKYEGLTVMAQVALLQAGYGEKALQDGLIKEPSLIQYIKSKKGESNAAK